MQNKTTTCSVTGCDSTVNCRGLCQAHYNRLKRYGSATIVKQPNVGRSCSTEGCSRAAKARGMCRCHWQRWRKTLTDGAPCSVPMCERVSVTGGMCHRHYEHQRKYGDNEYIPIIPDYFCSRCGTQKTPSDFSPSKKKSRGHQYWCRSCINEAQNEHGPSLETQRKRREYGLKDYGISIEDYETRYRQQNGCCAVCGIHKDPWEPFGVQGRNKFLHVDHDHATDNVRGLLCTGCNLGIGHMCDNPYRLRAAAKYLEES